MDSIVTCRESFIKISSLHNHRINQKELFRLDIMLEWSIYTLLYVTELKKCRENTIALLPVRTSELSGFFEASTKINGCL